jgi:hypothetical protein
MFLIFRGWPLRGPAIVTYETAIRSVAVDQQWTLYTTAPRRHAIIFMFHMLNELWYLYYHPVDSHHQQRPAADVSNFSPTWFSWTFLMAHSRAKLKSSLIKASPC